MAMPGNVLVQPYQPAPFDEPDDQPHVPPTVDMELGGTDLNDPSQGLQVKDWKFFLVLNDVVVAPAAGGIATTLFTRPNITWLSGAFDQNMAPAVVYIANDQATLWYFDTVDNAYVFFDLPAGSRTPFLTMDDKRATANLYNDILLFYVLNTNLVYRQQRNRYQVERIIASFNGPEVDITRCGMNKGLRVQIEVEGTGV